MRKKITILFALLLCLSVQGNARKTWDFAGKGFSSATIEAITNDATNWGLNNTAKPEDPRYKNATAVNGELMANDAIIPEFSELYFNMAAGNMYVGFTEPHHIRMLKNTATITLKKLVAGQTITIVSKSANTSTPRGISCSSGNATRTGGEETSLEENTNIWVVNSDVTDSVDVSFKTSESSGVNILSIIIDNGDDDIEDDDIRIAYLYDSSYNSGKANAYCGLESDPIFNNTLIQEKTYEAIDIKDFDATYTDTIAALESYDLIVVPEAIASGHAFAKSILYLVNRVPMLNFKSFFYKSGVWGWGTGKNPNPATNAIQLNASNAEHAIYENISLEEDSTINLYINGTEEGVTGNLVQAYECTDSAGFIFNDAVIATAGGLNAIHEHGKSNTYMLIPLSQDNWLVEGENNLSDACIELVNNAIRYLASTKSKVNAVTKPTIYQTNENGYTVVEMSSVTKGATLYYTLDGTEPTTASAVYSGPITLTDSCLVQTIGVMQGYNNSAIASAQVYIYTKCAAPTITVSNGEGNAKVVTITAAEGETIYYDFADATPSTASSVYTEPLIITRPTYISAIAAADIKLNSDASVYYVAIDNYTARLDTLAYANFNDQPTTWEFMKSDSTMATTGDIFAKYNYVALTDSTAPTYKEWDFKNGWKVGTYGQRINIQGGCNSGTIGGDYGPATAADAGNTANVLSFLVTNGNGQPCTAFLQTTKAYQGPFDICIWMCGQTNNTYTEQVNVLISTDATNWTVLDSVYCSGAKNIVKNVVYYDSKDLIYVKVASANPAATSAKQKTLISDVMLMGEGGNNPGLNIAGTTGDYQVIAVQYFNLSGIMLKAPEAGINIVRTIYSDGSVQIKKELRK